MAFFLEPSTWADIGNCTILPGTIGEPSRKMTFMLKVEGTSKTVTREMFVLNQPAISIFNVTGPTSVSKSAGGTPSLEVTGKYMHFTLIKWTSAAGSFTVNSPNQGITNSLSLFIPLSLMQSGYGYTALGVTTCGNEITIGGVTVTQ
jgi:hypothetical protein